MEIRGGAASLPENDSIFVRSASEVQIISFCYPVNCSNILYKEYCCIYFWNRFVVYRYTVKNWGI